MLRTGFGLAMLVVAMILGMIGLILLKIRVGIYQPDSNSWYWTGVPDDPAIEA